MKNLEIAIITGLSGSGKSTAIAAFEDAGFYCVDNMPAALLPKFLELPIESNSEISGLAFVMDLREKNFLSDYESVFESLRTNGYKFEIIFFEADEDVLLKRYSQTRRHHPLSQNNKGVKEGIRIEREQLKPLRRKADRIIDTSRYNVHELKSVILDMVQKIRKFALMRIHVMSFGFKFGVPYDADLIMDVRFLANPYFITDLKNLTGENEGVKNYVLAHEETRIFLHKFLDMLDFLIPLYEKEGKSYLTVAIGCTGGQHRSVVISREVFEHISKSEKRIEITHRDIGQDLK